MGTPTKIRAVVEYGVNFFDTAEINGPFNNEELAARYTFFRDDDLPVTPLPDGSGSLTSGVIGRAITRGDALAGD